MKKAGINSMKNSEKAQALFEQGNAYIVKGNYDRAIKDYTAVLKIKPDYELALCNRGAAYDIKGNYDEAIKDLETLLKINPNYDKAKLLLEEVRQIKASIMKWKDRISLTGSKA